MEKNPECYPRWLRDLVFSYSPNLTMYDRQETVKAMCHLHQTLRVATPIEKLIYNLCIDHERESIRWREEISRLEERVDRLECIVDRLTDVDN